MVPRSAQRRRQYCARCNRLMFEYFLSPDGHFGVVKEVCRKPDGRKPEVVCPTCGAVYELLDTVDATGQPVARKFRGA
ncbi:MAG: hypothetical protein ABSH52_30695 [Terriglobia bacterium]|jgi:hypothetical protein